MAYAAVAYIRRCAGEKLLEWVRELWLAAEKSNRTSYENPTNPIETRQIHTVFLFSGVGVVDGSTALIDYEPGPMWQVK